MIPTVAYGVSDTSHHSPLRPVTSIFSFNAGSAQVADTYLSPLIYSGWNTGFRYERLQAMKFSPKKWIMRLSIDLDGSGTKNWARNATMWQAQLNADWSMIRRWILPFRMSLGVGGITALNAGGIYTARNGNNPASAKASWTVGVTACAAYPLSLGRFKAHINWRGSIPVTGIFFSPDYGELYYEIWLGNTDGLVHGAWWGNYFRLENEIDLDISCGTTWLRLGYRSNILSTKSSDITTRIVYNSFVLGIATEWISIKSHKLPSEKTKIISAFY